jgi:hypothetical protein
MKRKTLMSQDGRRIINMSQIKSFSIVDLGVGWGIYADDIKLGVYCSEEDAEIELEQIGRYAEGWMDEETGMLDVRKDILRMGRE